MVFNVCVFAHELTGTTDSMMKRLKTFEEVKEGLAPLFAEEGTELVMLFGSVASEAVHPRSDIDIAVLCEKPVDILSLTNRVIRLLGRDEVDAVDLRRAAPLVRFLVATRGRILFEKRNGVFGSFCSLAFRMYIDSGKLRQAQKVAIQQYLETRSVR